MKKLFLLLLLVGFLFADIGPSPIAPSITVNISENGEPYLSNEFTLTYVCAIPPDGDEDSTMGSRKVILLCEEGICSNYGAWFYKFNPCFSNAEGYFKYEFKGKNYETAKFSINSKTNWFELELTTGKLKGLGGNENGSCLSLFIFLGTALFALRI